MLLELDEGFFKHFVTDDPALSHWHEDIQQRRTLLVSVGDSWTWGDSLGYTSHGKGISDPDRLNMVYGRHLQQMIGDCDWINIGYPGTANRWIVDVALRFIEIRNRVNYDKVFLSVGLTDISRDIFDLDIDSFYSSPLSLRDYMVAREKKLLKKIKKIQDSTDILVVVGRNFTNTFDPENIGICSNHLPLRWVDIGADRCGMARPPACFGFKIPYGLDYSDKKWVLDHVMDNNQRMTDYLVASPLHHERGTRHPTKECHRYWAEYVYEFIQDKLVQTNK
jgi:hypothetical protein